METIFRGKAKVFGDYINAYQILPDQYMKGGTNSSTLNAEEFGKHALEGADSTFASDALAGKYSIIVAGRNFGGGGKSIEHPIYAIKGAKVRAVIAESCSRYFFRNAINNGLLIMTCKGISEKVKTGDELEVDPAKGEIRNITTGVHLQSTPLPGIALEILEIGGYIAYTKKRLSAT
jgi:3-isopropylmalate/(R)-2-methylmalate dehydratase small subunit